MPGEDLRSIHIAVYALSLVGGAHQKVHTEFVAQKCLELAPDRFKWTHFPYPDKELVRKALFHASETKNGALVEGRAGMEQRGKTRDGWQLTPAGAVWMRKNEKTIEALAHPAGKSGEAVPKRDAERLLKRIRSEDAFTAFAKRKSVDQITPYMFTDMLNCSPDAAPDTIGAKYRRLLANAQLIGDAEIITFLTACGTRFSQLIAETAGGAR
jgi:hypothetical protein